MNKQTVHIHTEYIKLDALLKLANTVGSGGEAKLAIQEGQVQLNGDGGENNTFICFVLSCYNRLTI